MDFLSTIITFIATALLVLFLAFSTLILKIFTGKSIRDPKYAPVAGTVISELFHFNRLFDFQTEVAKTRPTFRILAPDQSDIYTTDSRNIEHILKAKFDKYSKGQENQDVAGDLFGQGIFAVDGEKWRQQRKLASFEFSTRVLRDFSCAVFRKNAANLVRTVSEFSVANSVFDVQDLLMRCTVDSIFKVGFGVDFNCLQGSSEEGSAFIKAFDDSTGLTYWRYLDPFWKLKRLLNIGSEASLKKNIKLIDDFVHNLISTKRKQLSVQQDSNDKEDILSRFLVESKKDPAGMNDKYLRDIILNFMIAGKDTSATTLSWFFYMLCKNPLIQEKVAQEVKEIATSSQVDGARVDDFIENVTDEVLEKMHYLHSALTETLRLFPAVPVEMENDDAMEVSGGSSSDVWATRNEKIFIQLMDEEVKSKKSRETGTFTAEAWKRIRSELKKLTGYPYTKEQLKNKYNALRALFNSFNSLKANTGVGWDSTLLTITAPDDVWARLFKVNKQARGFKKKGMPYYHELCRIFGDTSATGVHAHPSNKAPSSTDSSDPEFQFKDEPEVESEGSKVKSKGKRKRKDSFAANISSALSQFAENGKRRVDVLEKQLHGSLPSYGGVSGSASIGEMGLGPLAAGMAQCQALLNTMEDLDEDSYNKVLEKLHDDVLWRQIFMDMPEQRRLAWIKRL